EVALNQIHAFDAEKGEITKGGVVTFKELGQKILKAEYKTSLSRYVFPNPDEIKERETFVDESWEKMAALYKSKLAVLEDDLAREKRREHPRVGNTQHGDRHKKITAWVNDSLAYLKTKEQIDSVASADAALNKMTAYEADKVVLTNQSVAPLKQLGK